MAHNHFGAGGVRALRAAACVCAAVALVTGSKAPARAQSGAQSAAESGERRAFDIESQPLDAAIAAFGASTGLQVTVNSEIGGDLVVAPVAGTLTVDEALDRMLVGTGLVWRRIDPDTILLSSASRIQEAEPGAVLLAPVVVTAGRREQSLDTVPRSVLSIEKDTLDRYREQSGNLNEILPKVIPGFGSPIFITETRALTLRGRQALFLIDGIPVSANGVTELQAFDPLTIDRVEVLYGPTALYGNGATGGVIQFFTNEPSPDPYEIRVQTQLRTPAVSGGFLEGDGLGYRVFGEVSGTLDRFSYLASASFDRTGYFFDTDGDVIAPGQINDSKDVNFFAKAGVDITPDQRIQGYVNYTNLFQGDIDFATVAAVDANDTATAVSVDPPISFAEEPEQETFFANLVYSHDDLFDGSLRLQGYYRNEDVTSIGTDIRELSLPESFPVLFQTGNEIEAFGFRGDYSREFFDRLTVQVGGDYLNTDSETPTVISTPDAFDATNFFDGATTVGQFAPIVIENWGLFLQGDLTVIEDLTLSGGVRYDRFSFDAGPNDPPFGLPTGVRPGGSGANDGFSFNVGASYNIAEQTLFASFAQGFSLPLIQFATNSPLPGVSISGSNLIEPIQVNSFEAGIRGRLGPLSYSLAGFYAESDNGSFIVIDPDDGTGEIFRSPQRNYGFEISTRLDATEDLRFGLDVSWNEGSSDGDDDGTFDPLGSLTVPPLKVSVTGEWQPVDKLTLDAQLLYIGDRDRAFDAGVETFAIDGFTTLDIGASYELGPGRLALRATNLLNNDYLPVESQTRFGTGLNRRVAAPGRLLTLTYSAEF
ncbi:MAG: TonB-dependent receptor [Pseudomonadota bacterium]